MKQMITVDRGQGVFGFSGVSGIYGEEQASVSGGCDEKKTEAVFLMAKSVMFIVMLIRGHKD